MCKSFLCEKCGSSIFTTKNALINHENRCMNTKASQIYALPKTKNNEDEIPSIEFKDFDKLIRVPFKIYADFESYFDVSSKNKNADKVKITSNFSQWTQLE
jgi:hypothetical protein